MRKKLLSLALALCMALALLPTTALAADSDFVIEDGVLTKYTGAGGDVVIPDGVTSIGEQAFSYCTNLTSVSIPDSVISIEDAAFFYCLSLINVSIPDSVTSIGDNAFGFCGSLTSVSIPDSVTSIKEGAFYQSGLTSVTIPGSVTNLEDSVFFKCTDLTSVIIQPGVISIGKSAFRHTTNLTSVSIPDSVISIGDYAFYECVMLPSITIPDGVTSIGDCAFSICRHLASITIPSSVTSIGDCAFDYFDLTDVTDVYYGGSESKWSTLAYEFSDNVIIHYNSSGPAAVEPDPAEPPVPTVGGFSDVHEGDFYDSAVLWAVNNGITNGTSGTTFSPNSSCSRAQIVTFLYRAMDGKAVTGSNPFTDVTGSGEIYDAILWALNKEITSGTTTTTFSPNDTCSRAQVVTFLWRALDRPEPENSQNSFTDVPSDGDIGTAIQWAVDNGITSGTSTTTFSPNDACSRAQVVTFLYRAFVNA